MHMFDIPRLFHTLILEIKKMLQKRKKIYLVYIFTSFYCCCVLMLLRPVAASLCISVTTIKRNLNPFSRIKIIPYDTKFQRNC